MKPRLILGLLATMAMAAACAPACAATQDEIDRAIEKGVQALRDMQRTDGTWPYQHIGATALAGLTLLECGAKEDDKAVQRAADAVRKASVNLTHTYSIALSILFFDRLGDAEDKPLIESLMVRLLGGQDPRSGGWTYDCPQISDAERKRLQDIVDKRKEKEAADRRDSAKPGTKQKDNLSPEIRDQLNRLERNGQVPPQGAGAPGFPGVAPPAGMPVIVGGPGDNSNTQFAALALWVGHRYGVPIERALTRLDRRFRSTQMEDGGWSYMPMPRPPGMPANTPMPFGMGSTAAMTCAGVFALALADGATLELVRKRKPDAKLPDISKDENLNKGLEAIGAIIDNPKGLKPDKPDFPGAPAGPPAPQLAPFQRVGGRTYYFLWSLERVGMALNLKTIGKKDWYGWGAEILVDNQEVNGAWRGEYAAYGADTCFALLFLKRANLARDLSDQLKGRVMDPAERVLRPSVGVDKLRGGKKIASGIETRDAKPLEKPMLKETSAEGRRLADAVLKATGPRRDELIDTMEREKGVKYTEALAAAIPKLEGEARRKAREALANRLTRMKDDTLADYLKDDDAEIRRAAALAVGQKDSKAMAPNLIALLRDPEISVVRAAHASLKSLTGQDFGPSAKATREERDQAVLKWIDWWSKQRKKTAKE